MFKAEAKRISDLFNRKVLSVPRNQRKYVWDKTNWEDLFSDLKFILDKDQPKGRQHFIGSIVLQVGDDEKGLTSCSIIDGQQRTVTITLLLLSLLVIFKENKINDSFTGTRKYLVFIDDEGNEQFILSSPNYISIKNIATKVIDLTNNDSVDSLIKKYIYKKDEKVYGNCLKYFYNRLKESSKEYDNLKSFLNGIRDALVQTNYIDISAQLKKILIRYSKSLMQEEWNLRVMSLSRTLLCGISIQQAK